MEYELIYKDLRPKLIFPAEDNKAQISKNLADYILSEMTKYKFTLSEVRGLLARVYDVAMIGARVDFSDD